jgi:transposase-like protein
MAKDVQVIRGKFRSVFTDEQKKEIVDKSYESRLSLNAYSKSVGISPASLCNWRKDFESDCSKEVDPRQAELPMVMNDRSDEISQLNAKIEALTKENFQMRAFIGQKLFQLEFKM